MLRVQRYSFFFNPPNFHPVSPLTLAVGHSRLLGDTVLRGCGNAFPSPVGVVLPRVKPLEALVSHGETEEPLPEGLARATLSVGVAVSLCYLSVFPWILHALFTFVVSLTRAFMWAYRRASVKKPKSVLSLSFTFIL